MGDLDLFFRLAITTYDDVVILIKKRKLLMGRLNNNKLLNQLII